MSFAIGYDSAFKLTPTLASESVEKIIKREKGFDLGDELLRDCLSCYEPDVTINYLLLANEKLNVSRNGPFILIRKARDKSRSYIEQLRAIKESLKIPICCSAQLKRC